MIKLIEEPVFQVNYLPKPLIKNNKSLIDKIIDLTTRIFDDLKLILISFKNAVYLNTKYFVKIIFVVFTPFPTNGAELLLKIVLCTIFSLGSVIYDTGKEYLKARAQRPEAIASFADPKVNLSHMIAYDIAIKTNHLPNQLQVNSLLPIFDAINFTDPTKPGYFNPNTLKDDGKMINPQKLRKNLQTFIYNVEHRVPIIGTPPANTPHLFRFYDQITAAIRASIYEIQKNNDPHEIGRLAIDLAIAGGHCGGRYMGEAMDAYLWFSGSHATTFKEILHEHFAKERVTLAKQHIEKYFSVNGKVNTHAFSAYMANVGPILGLPGTKDVVEHLTAHRFNTSKALQKFFAEYNKEFIMQKLQQLLTTDRVRELASMWFKEQAADWNKEFYKDYFILTPEQLQSCFTSEPKTYQLLLKFKQIRDLAQTTDIDEMFSLPAVKALFTTPLQRQQFQQAIMKPELAQYRMLDPETIKPQLSKIDAAIKLNSLLNSKDISTNIPTLLNHIHSPQPYIDQCIDLMRREEFFQKLQVNNTLKKEAIEWLAIEHSLLNF